MSESRADRKFFFSNEHFTGGLIFATTLLVFWFSPVHQVSDSKYSMLVSQCLLYHRSFALDHYQVPRLEPFQREDYLMDGDIYQLEIAKDHIYYFFPPGSTLLSVPYVALANLYGLNAAFPDGTYNHQGEIDIESGLAAILMAALACIFFYTARLVLPVGWSALVALGGAFGTQVWSTASRAMWSHTWGILLLGIVVYMLLAQETGKRELRPVLLATLLSWMYFVRPSNSIFIAAVSVYILLYYRRLLVPYIITGVLWLMGFVFYSWQHFGRVLPNYYRANRLKFDAFLIAFPGNLISPARGLLVYVPVLLFVAFLLARYWRERPFSRLTWLALIIFVVNLIVISGFPHWWGGASFGPRFTTDAVPWFVLLAIISVKAMLTWRGKHQSEHERKAVPASWTVQLAAGALLLALSMFINARGALSINTWKWNETPKDVVLVQKKLWDWRQPQFLAGLIRPPLDRAYPLIETDTRIDFTKPEADKYLWYGWSGAEPRLRWSEADEAALVFALNRIDDVSLRIRLSPFAPRGVHEQQRFNVDLNGQRVHTSVLNEERPYDISLTLPKNLLRRENVLTFGLPDAASPESLKISIDQRPLGVAVEWMEFSLSHR
ncbi:MAG TPA: hypothetical protein VGO91_19975 [Pyrinomonadaceae bacterium]|jgi:hypothetical protein|nr:hypothetical protein [Pyrinomonadaceae bacterium]